MFHGLHKITLLLALVCAIAQAQPAHHLFDVTVPSGGTPLLRPSGVFVDPRTQELYVADTGNSRIVIFDRLGHYDFSFTDRRHLTAPKCLAADSLGRIYVQNEGSGAALQVFDYNGAYLNDLELLDPSSQQPLAISSFLIDARDRLFAATVLPAHLYVFTTAGAPLDDFALFTELDSLARGQSTIGSLSIVNGDLMIPMPMLSQVARYTLDGEFRMVFGIPGSGARELAFPVAVTSDGHGGLLVLDRMRHSILQYGDDGRTIGERGGFGRSGGWFYLPSAMVSGPDGLCYVAQMQDSRVQAVRVTSEIPETKFAVGAEETK